MTPAPWRLDARVPAWSQGYALGVLGGVLDALATERDHLWRAWLEALAGRAALAAEVAGREDGHAQ